uniref:Uncharacterized protein n=1 Tax=Arundo donax TaxID=35708 RepID=A0A0A9HSF3_ARUDO
MGNSACTIIILLVATSLNFFFFLGLFRLMPLHQLQFQILSSLCNYLGSYHLFRNLLDSYYLDVMDG